MNAFSRYVGGLWLALLALLVMMSGPMLWPNGVLTTDSGVFAYGGMVLQAGGVPYIDAFDHKGPLIFLINWLGLSLGTWRGIGLCEFLAIVVTLYYIYRTASLLTSSCMSGYVTVACALIWAIFLYNSGNFTEEYAVPFIAMAHFYVMRYLLANAITARSCFAMGVGMAMVLLLRPNMVVMWVVGIPVLMYSLYKNGSQYWYRYLCAILGGLLCGILPFSVWLYAEDALSACWDAYILFNMQYVTVGSAGVSVGMRIKALAFFLLAGPLEAYALGALALYKQKSRLDGPLWLEIALMASSMVSVCMSGRLYHHYGVILVPFLAVPLALFGQYLAVSIIKRNETSGRLLPALVIISIIIFMGKCIYSQTKPSVANDDLPKQIATYIREHSRADERISVWGNRDVIYVLSHRLAVSRYSYQFPIGRIRPQIMEEYFAAMEATPPRFIVLDEPADSTMQAFLAKHDYAKIKSYALSRDNEVLELYELTR